MTTKKNIKINESDDNEPYSHPKLQQQVIIRFPQDISARLNAEIETNELEDFEITFIDDKNAKIKIYDEELNGTLYSLPTYIESHRTVDMSHLYKSADIGEILIVERQNTQKKDYLAENGVFEDGLTPPTSGIVLKRNAKKESAIYETDSSIKGIDYWEIVEIQLNALLSKDKKSKPIVRHEFFEEPDVDAGHLERVLRKKFGDDYKGYSGTEISEKDLDEDITSEPIIIIPDELIESINKKNKIVENQNLIINEEESENEIIYSIPENISQEIQPQPVNSLPLQPLNSNESENDSYNLTDEEEEEENITSKINNINNEINKFENTLLAIQKRINSNINEITKERFEKQKLDIELKIQSKKDEIKNLLSK